MRLTRYKAKILIFMGITLPAIGFMMRDTTVNAALAPPFRGTISHANYVVFERLPASASGSRRSLRKQVFQLSRLSPTRKSSTNQLREWRNFKEDGETIGMIYHPALTKSIEARYKREVLPAESVAESPYRFARPWEQEKYLEKNNEMAQWMAKEVANDSIKNILDGADKDAAPIRVAANAKFLLGSEMGDGDKKAVENSAPRKGLKPARGQTTPAPEYYATAPEEVIPTKLRYKMNVIRQRGEVNFTNPIVNTSLNVDMQRELPDDSKIQTLDTSDRVSAQVSKNIKPLKLDSSVSYGMNRKVVSVNLSKKITDQITCDVTSQRFTNQQRDANGRNSAEQVRIGYSLSF